MKQGRAWIRIQWAAGDEEGIGGADRMLRWSVRPDARRAKRVPQRGDGGASTQLTGLPAAIRGSEPGCTLFICPKT